MMERVEVTRIFVGICHMQVCAASDASDEEILIVCNRDNPSGTTGGWSSVAREAFPEASFFKGGEPVQCENNSERKHFLVGC